MPALNWEAFAQLPGGTERNFEVLCRNLIRRHYQRYGSFAALAAQPGVEFHLKLHIPCSLGAPGRWYGWQCRWYDLPGGRALGNMRRRKIVKAIETTEKVLPDLTDWILWTRRPLTAGDQRWFRSLKTHMRLQLWSAEEVEEHLSGEAAVLRESYFGELVLTPNVLTDLFDESVAPIRRRWQPETHQAVDAERALRKMLAESESWRHLRETAEQLKSDALAVSRETGELDDSHAAATKDVVRMATDFAAALTEVHIGISRGDLDLLRQKLRDRPGPPDATLRVLPRKLRARRYRAALMVTNALAEAQRAIRLLDDVNSFMEKRMVAVLAEAGCGKTQLAAQLCAPTTDRPAGVLIHGRTLHAGHSLDDLARQVVISAVPVTSMEALLEAVDAAGQRAHRRLPIVIDGLNEAEDPREWKPLLSSLDVTLQRYPYVLIACTIRNVFVGEAIPEEIDRIEIPDFGLDAMDAIVKYFSYYRIDARDAELPFELLKHPLTLRLFCEVTNPTRERTVGVEAMPGSLTALFERFLDQAAERIAQLAPLTWRYYQPEVREALDEIGIALWEEKNRNLDEATLRQRIGDAARPWNESMICALMEEGILLRHPAEPPAGPRVAGAYDALAGHLVAGAILARYGRTGFEKWLKDPAVLSVLGGPIADQHPLAADTFRALVGLVPRQLPRQQFWSFLEPPLRATALRAAADLEAKYLDAMTVAELSSMVAGEPSGTRDLLERLWQTRGSPPHPLNAAFLDSVLRPMSVGDRDSRWTEWIRRDQDYILQDLRYLGDRWRRHIVKRSHSDQLRARWVAWTLTSTVRDLRDQATTTLYWFGRGDPLALFDLTLDALSINDLYVPERLFAASYGVAMAHQLPDPTFAKALNAFLTGIRDALVGPAAKHPTSHWLARLYARGTVELALRYHPAAVPEGLSIERRTQFAPGPAVDPIPSSDPRASEVNLALHTDFENYTVGGLFEDRSNYDMKHAGHQVAAAHVRGVVWSLGWREASLGKVDRKLDWQGSRSDRARVERYGKKYGWIGFYTFAGVLEDRSELRPSHGRLADVDIDPSFPEPPPAAPFELPMWARPVPRNDRRWIRRGAVRVPDQLFYCPEIDSHQGPWMAVAGHLTDNQTPGRHVFGFLIALFVEPSVADQVASALASQEHPDRWSTPTTPEDFYTFAGEIPWNTEFARGDREAGPAALYRETLGLPGLSRVSAEIIAHRYAWESYHCTLNKAGGALVPSWTFSQRFALRGLPQSFDQVLIGGNPASISLGAPPGFGGHLLYLREDLVHKFAKGRSLIWFIWGHRGLRPVPFPQPAWFVNAQRSGASVWRKICRAEELSPVFASSCQFRRSRRR